MANARPSGKGTRPRAAVGRDALIPPHPAAAGTPAGGINPSPTTAGGSAVNRAKRGPAVISDLCRGRCLHCARRRVSEANRATGPALRPEIVPGTLPRIPVLNFDGAAGVNARPTGRGQHGGPTGNRRPRAATNPCRGGFHIRPVRGGARSRGRAKSLPYKPWRTPGQMAPPPGAAKAAAGGVPFYGVVVTGNVKTLIRRPAALRGPARRCGS